jgi:S-adenosylmethionine:tRNA ribosyltransferase-isomerase
MKVADFDFELPSALIAQEPARPRDSARLLHVAPQLGNSGLDDLRVTDLPKLVHPGDVMVFNDTRVIPARLNGWRGAAKVEVTLMMREAKGNWTALARPGRRLKPGDFIDFAPNFAARVIEKRDSGDVVLAFDMADGDLRLALETHGIMPLPPYIKRPRDASSEISTGAISAKDRADYQTTYAKHDGAVAAPTAGLHFTPAIMSALKVRDVTMAFVTLHVGAGTFQPVKVEDTDDHIMHSEWGAVTRETADTINEARSRGGRVIAVGTTSLRLIESAAAVDGVLHPFQDTTDIFITPGYRFKAIDAMVTNFHLPRSTLFMLVSALAGLDRMKAAYAHAIAQGYRFYSYGDACFLERQPEHPAVIDS